MAEGGRMKVKEYIELLKKFDGDMEIVKQRIDEDESYSDYIQEPSIETLFYRNFDGDINIYPLHSDKEITVVVI